jgi:hypothetical protein
MAVVNPLPYTIQNGQAVDAVPVMANFNQIVSNVNANAAPVAGNASQTFAVANATAASQAVNWAQAGTQVLTPAASSTITPVAFNTLVLPGFSAAGTITVNPGSFTGQRVRVYGCGYTVTVQTNVASGFPALFFPDGSSSYAWANYNTNQAIEVVWDGVNWRATTTGKTVAASASASNQVVTLGQVATPSNLGYSNVTGSRAIGTTYTNSTGRPLLVQVEVYTAATAGAGTRILVNGTEVSCFYTPVAVSTYGVMTAVVPPGQTYQVANASGSNSIAVWQEY